MKRDPAPAPTASDVPKRVVLDVQGLRTGYGDVPVLHGISLRLHEGEALGIVGHNGMGKTTLLKAIMGQLPVTAGRIEIAGIDMTQQASYTRSRHGVGYVAQGRGILPGLSAHENLRLAWRPDCGETEERAIERVLDMFPRLTRLLDRRGGLLSGGEQQILALARALVPSPWLLFLDEPSEGIAPKIVEEMANMILELKQEGLSVLISEQNLHFAALVSDRAYVIEKGHIRYGGTMAQLEANEEVKREYLSV